MKTNEWYGRYALLFFDCIVGFGVFFCQDIPGALQADIQGLMIPCGNHSANISSNVTCCDDCLGLGPDKFNDLYSVFSWMNALLALPGGYIIDRIGNRASMIVVSVIATIGSAILAIAVSFIRGSAAVFPLMIIGRLLLGTTTGCTMIVQDRVVAFWFSDKMALAFGITYTTERLGNVVNFFVTDNISSIFGLSGAFWAGAVVCFCAFCGALVFSILDRYGTKILDKESQANMLSTPVKLADIKGFPSSYWLIAFMISSYYSCFIPFVGNGSKFIQDKYGYPETASSYMNGAIYFTCCLLFPVCGLVLDKKGGRALILLLATSVTVPIFPLMYYTSVIHPLIFSVWLGLVYTLSTLCLWSLVAVIVPPTCLGTACGIATCLQGLGVGFANLAVGEILGRLEKSTQDERFTSWKWVLLLLMIISAFCTACGTLLNLTNRKLVKKMNAVISNTYDYEKKGDLMNGEKQNERKRLISKSQESNSYSSLSSANNSYTIQ